MVLLLDNYDSFTYNLAQYLGELGCDVEVHRNDKISVEEIARRKPERIVISPGPCTPQTTSPPETLSRQDQPDSPRRQKHLPQARRSFHRHALPFPDCRAQIAPARANHHSRD